MSLVTLTMRPGINLDITRRQNEGGWSDSNRIRFRQGVPETIGGWQKIVDSSVIGVPRRMLTWTSIAGEQYIAVATESKLYIYNRGTFYDVTPIRRTVTLGSDPLTTTSGSAIVTVADTAHGAIAGDWVTIAGAVAVGGISAGNLDGQRQVRSVTTDTWTFEADANATSSATGGGADIDVAYEINSGRVNSGFTGGWGSGGWGRGGWIFKGATSQTLRAARTWSLDNWGEWLVAAPEDGGIYSWKPSDGLSTRATVITNAPTRVTRIIVSPDDRHMLAFGHDLGSAFDPLSVAWCSQEDLEDWSPSATDTAGDFRISSGNRFVSVLRAPGEILAWTDSALYSARFIGPPYTFGFRFVAGACGAVSPMSTVMADGKVMWRGRGEFFVYAGTVDALPSTVMQQAFEQVNTLQEFKITGGVNSRFNEVWWFHPSSESTENDRYVKFNYVEGTWDVGQLDRTAWSDQDTFRDPIGASPDGYLYWHEFGITADGEAMGDFIESSDIDIGEGDQVIFIDKLIPDFIQTGEMGITLRARAYPHDTYYSKGPYSVLQTTKRVSPRLRGRQIAFRIESTGVNAKWRYGAFRIEMRPDGER